MSARWKPSGIVPLRADEGEGADRRVYETTELICSEELEEEGQAMRHCIAAYWQLLRVGAVIDLVADRRGRLGAGRAAADAGGQERAADGSCRHEGQSNRMPTAAELAILDRWTGLGDP